MQTAKRFEAGVQKIPGLEVLGRPDMCVIAFGSTEQGVNIYKVNDLLGSRGWHLNALQNPPAIHVAVTLPIVAVVDQLVADLVECVEEVKEQERRRIAEGKGAKGAVKGDTAALYGVAGSLPNKSVVVDLAKGFLDTLYKV